MQQIEMAMHKSNTRGNLRQGCLNVCSLHTCSPTYLN